MTVLIHDAKADLGSGSTDVSKLIYADDTLIVAAQNGNATEYMRAIARAGAQYGLQYN